MASVHSVEERGFILSLYQSVIATDWLWLGGSNSPEGGWAWSGQIGQPVTLRIGILVLRSLGCVFHMRTILGIGTRMTVLSV